MSDPFLAEIRMFPLNFAPKGWAVCDGQLLSISQNTALFSLLGTVYGGDGTSTFALPDLRGRAPMHPGHSTASTRIRDLGEQDGSDMAALQPSELPSHNHTLRASSQPGEDASGVSGALGRSMGAVLYESDASTLESLAPEALAPAGGGMPHENMQPFLTTQFCIAVQGVFPPRS